MVLAAVLGVLIAAGAPASGHSTPRACPPKNSHTVAKGRYVRVLRPRARGSDLTACRYATGERRRLENREDGRTAFGRPSLDVAGNWAATAILDETDPNAFPTFVAIDAVNVRTGKRRGVYADPGGFVDVGPVKVTPRGSLAWVTCAPSMGPNPCTETGADDRVYAWAAEAEKPTLVGSGKDIDPSSLALHGTTLSWLQGGVLRSAPLR